MFIRIDAVDAILLPREGDGSKATNPLGRLRRTELAGSLGERKFDKTTSELA